MTLSPVTLAEVRAHLQFDPADVVDDDELWSTTLAAVNMVESKMGALRVREVTERVVLSCQYDATWQDPPSVTQWPVIGDLTVVAVDETGPFRFLYDVTYTVGRVPISEDAMEAVLLQTGLLWSSQRGPAASSRFTSLGSDDIRSPSGIDRARLKDILADYTFSAIL